MIVMGFLMVGGVISMGVVITRDVNEIVRWSKERSAELEKRRQELQKRKEEPNA